MKLETKKKIRNYFNIGRKSKPLDSVSEFSELKFTFFTLATELMHKLVFRCHAVVFSCFIGPSRPPRLPHRSTPQLFAMLMLRPALHTSRCHCSLVSTNALSTTNPLIVLGTLRGILHFDTRLCSKLYEVSYTLIQHGHTGTKTSIALGQFF